MNNIQNLIQNTPRMQAIQPRGKRNVAVSLMLRSMYDKQRTATSNGEVSEKFLKDMKDTYEFMKSSRLHNVSKPPQSTREPNVDTDLNMHGETLSGTPPSL